MGKSIQKVEIVFGRNKTSFKIGSSVGIIILLLGVTVMFGVYQTSQVSNEIIVISQEYAPLSEIISDIRFQKSNQELNLEKIIRFSEKNNILELEKAKEEFWLGGNIIQSNLERGKKIVNAGIDIGASGAYNEEFELLLEKLVSIHQNHKQYEILTNELISNLEFSSDEFLIGQIKDSETLIERELETIRAILSNLANESTNQIELNEKDSLTGQIAIITIVGAIAATLGVFISQINSDLKKEVDLKTKELQKANEKLKELDKMKDEFIGIASHELKSPIQPILGFAELAKAGDIDQKVAWDGVLELGTKLQDLANAVLDVSRIESNRLDLQLEKVRINDLILETTKSQKISLKKPVIIRENLDENIEVEIDRVRISQVFRNLVNNAIKFTQNGSIVIETHVYLDKNKIQVKVTDTGLGIPDEILDKIFGKFVTKGNKYEKQSGTGLGLFLCKGIIEAHGGQIAAHNNFECGATFEFSLPISNKNKIQKLPELASK
jgi:signal transduction histidine kinase